MSATETATPPPVHHYEEQDLSMGQRIGNWLKGQYALYILVALLLVATITRGAVFWGPTNLTNRSPSCASERGSQTQPPLPSSPPEPTVCAERRGPAPVRLPPSR